MKIILIRGNSGSGKTTLARRVHTMLKNSALISRDPLRQTTASEDMPDALIRAVQQAEAEAYDYAIVEGVLGATGKYASFFHFLRNMYDEIYAYYYDLPFSETLRRHKNRDCCQEFGTEEMQRWYRPHDQITAFFPETVFHENHTLDEAFHQIMHDLHYITHV